MGTGTPRYAEDYPVGEKFDLGSYVLTMEEILEFSTRWDPHPFHIDEEQARRSPFGGIIASGWHVTLILMRLMHDSGFISLETSVGSPGHDGLKWIKPVRPGERLFGSAVITGLRISKSRPELGFVTNTATLRNDKGEDVYELKSTAIVKTRVAAH